MRGKKLEKLLFKELASSDILREGNILDLDGEQGLQHRVYDVHSLGIILR
jgi:hypothetical protein